MSDIRIPGTPVHAARPGSRPLTAELLWEIPRVGGPIVSSTGDLLVPVTTWEGDDRSKRVTLWLLGNGASEPQAIIPETHSAGAACWSPDGQRIACILTSREADPEPAQLYLLTPGEELPNAVTDLPLGVLDVRWMPDGNSLVVVSRLISGHATIEETRAEKERRKADPVKVHATEKRLFRFWDQWLTDEEIPHFFHLNPTTGECRDLTPDSQTWLDFMSPTGQFDIAPDGSEIAFAGMVPHASLNELTSHIFRVPLSGDSSTCLTTDVQGHCNRPRYTADGSGLVWGQTEDRYYYADRDRLYRYDLETQSVEPWCVDWDQAPASWEFASDGGLILTAEDAARTHLYRLSPNDSTPAIMASGGSIQSPVAAADGTVYFVCHSLQDPPEIYRLKSGSETADRLTHLTADAMRDVRLGEVREIQVTGAAGETVQSYVILPPHHDASQPAAFINVVHGGPHGIWGDEFHFRWNAQLFAAGGYVVAFPNFQGSTSWGTDFGQRIQGNWSERPFGDIMAVTDHLIDCGLIDPDRMAAAGGSYGGYMMAWIAGHTSRFRCLVNHAGVYNTLSMYASDATQGRGRSFGGEPWRGIDVIDTCNPARFADGMETPMLVIHGEQDYRVPVTQGLECYGVLQAKGIPARLVHYPDENHWILKPHNSIRWYREVFDWIGRWLS